jgi:hypothetical protein
MCAKNCAHPAIFFFLSPALQLTFESMLALAKNPCRADRTRLAIFHLRSATNLLRRANECSIPAAENRYNLRTELLGQPAIKDNSGQIRV